MAVGSRVSSSVCSSARVEVLSDLLASVRRQGLRADNLLKDSDNLLQRHRNLEARLQHQAETLEALEGECRGFHTQAKSTEAWVKDLQQRLLFQGSETNAAERTRVTQVC